MKNKRTIIIISSVVVFIIIIVVVVYFYYKKKKEKEENDQQPEPEKKPTGTTIIVKKDDQDPYINLPKGTLPMKLGQRSKIVGIMQMALNDIHGSGLIASGTFEKSTENALLKNYGTKTADYNTCSKIYNNLIKDGASSDALILYNTLILKK